MHKQKALTIICVAIGVLVLLLTQTEGFEDYYQEQLDARQKSAQFMAYLNAEKDAAAATRSEWQSAWKMPDFKEKWKTEMDAGKKFNQIVSEEALKKGFDPRIGDMVYWEQHYGNGQPAPIPQPAVKSVQAVAPSQPIVKKAQPITPSQPIVKKAQPITPSQPAPAIKVQNTAIPPKKTK